jgi:hypothetical protein
VGRDRLPDDEFLDSAHVAHFPIALRALRVRVVAVDAGGIHDDGRDQPHAAVEDRAGDVVDAGVRSLSQGRERLALELVEGVGRAIPERIVRKKAEADIVVAFADHAAELEGERGGDGNAAGHIDIVGNDMGRAAVGQHAGDDIAGIIAADAVDHHHQLGRLAAQCLLGQIAHVEPDRDRQAGENDQLSRMLGSRFRLRRRAIDSMRGRSAPDGAALVVTRVGSLAVIGQVFPRWRCATGQRRAAGGGPECAAERDMSGGSKSTPTSILESSNQSNGTP